MDALDDSTPAERRAVVAEMVGPAVDGWSQLAVDRRYALLRRAQAATVRLPRYPRTWDPLAAARDRARRGLAEKTLEGLS